LVLLRHWYKKMANDRGGWRVAMV